jgi:hypothetical protein
MWNKNKGVVVITMVLLLVGIASLVTVYTGQVRSFEYHILGNNQNHQSATLAAGVGIATVESLLISEPEWEDTWVTGVDAANGSFNVAIYREQLATQPRHLNLISLTATGHSADGLAKTIINEQLLAYSLLYQQPPAPLLVTHGVNEDVIFKLVANANGGGTGVPVSLWTNGHIDMEVTEGVSCGLAEYEKQICDEQAYSSGGEPGADLVINDEEYPTDLLAYLFNTRDEDWVVLSEEADITASDCSDISSTSVGLLWISGDCSLAANTLVGSQDAPVIFVVSRGNLHLEHDAVITGLVVCYRPPTSTHDCTITMDENAFISGALATNPLFGLQHSELVVVYDPEAMTNVQSYAPLMRIGRIPGSWKDY